MDSCFLLLKFRPIQRSLGSCLLLLKFRPVQPSVDSCFRFKNLDRFSSPWNLVSTFKNQTGSAVRGFLLPLQNSDRSRGPWIPTSLFKYSDRFSGPWIPAYAAANHMHWICGLPMWKIIRLLDALWCPSFLFKNLVYMNLDHRFIKTYAIWLKIKLFRSIWTRTIIKFIWLILGGRDVKNRSWIIWKYLSLPICSKFKTNFYFWSTAISISIWRHLWWSYSMDLES